jgi:hypothetical protein
MKSKAKKQTMPQAKEKLQRLKAVSTYLQSPEIRSSSSSCVDTSKQQQQPATKLCQSTKCKTEYTVLRVLFSHFKITQNSDLEPPHAIQEKNPNYKIHTKLSRNSARAQRYFLELHENRRCASGS